VRVEVVQDQHNLLGLRLLHIDQFLDHRRKGHRRPPRRHLDLPVACQRLAHHKQIGRALPLVLLIDPRRPPWGRWEGLAGVSATSCLLVSSRHT